MSLGVAAGVLVVTLLMAEAANLAIRTRQAGTSQGPRPQTSLKQAIAFLAFAVLFAILMWVEHMWRLGRGDYAGLGLRHTWYWTATNGVALVVCLGRLSWLGWRVSPWATRERANGVPGVERR